MRRAALALALALTLGMTIAMTLAGCGLASEDVSPIGDTSSDANTSSTSITVLAAASLTEAFTEIGTAFELANPGVTVRFSFGPSSGLAQQIVQGAPADVFASASTKTMDVVTSAGEAARATTFAANDLAIAVPPSNPANITGLRDLAREGVKVAMCQVKVPCGTVAARVIEKAGVRVVPVTEEADVKSVLAKVALGEVDAGLVYVTDVQAAGTKVRGIAIPAAVNASTDYPIAVLTAAEDAVVAQAFVDYVLSPAGRSVLDAAGFRAP